MAQTKKKRQTKHRGNAAGVVEARGRTGRPPTPEEKKRSERNDREQARQARLSRPPSWKTAFRNSAIMAVLIFVFLLFTNRGRGSGAVLEAIVVALLAFALYTPGGYYMEKFMWQRRMKSAGQSTAAAKPGTKRGR